MLCTSVAVYKYGIYVLLRSTDHRVHYPGTRYRRIYLNCIPCYILIIRTSTAVYPRMRYTHGMNRPIDTCSMGAPRSCSNKRSSIRKSALTGWCTLSMPWKLPVTIFTLPSTLLSAFPSAMDPLSNSSSSPSFVDHHSRARNNDINVLSSSLKYLWREKQSELLLCQQYLREVHIRLRMSKKAGSTRAFYCSTEDITCIEALSMLRALRTLVHSLLVHPPKIV